MDKIKQNYVLALSLMLAIGLCVGIAGTKLLTKEKVCADCICEKTICQECTKCPDCKCPDIITGTAPEEVFCNQPSEYDCFPHGALNANVSKIDVTCSNGRIKIWLCQENKWKE